MKKITYVIKQLQRRSVMCYETSVATDLCQFVEHPGGDCRGVRAQEVLVSFDFAPGVAVAGRPEAPVTVDLCYL